MKTPAGMYLPRQRERDVYIRAMFSVKGVAGTDSVTFRPALEDLHARAKREAAELIGEGCKPEEIVILDWRFVV